jgi:hypothetical protein
MFGLKDTIHFGRYKGIQISSILNDNPEYICWLRNSKKAAGETLLTADADAFLDKLIEEDRNLRKVYGSQKVKSAATSLKDIIRNQVAAISGAEAALNAKVELYSEEWGSW